MPHIIIEHSENAFKADLFDSLLEANAQACAETQLFKPENIKVRLHPVKNFQLTKPLSNFVHIQMPHPSRQKSRAEKTFIPSAIEWHQ